MSNNPSADRLESTLFDWAVSRYIIMSWEGAPLRAEISSFQLLLSPVGVKRYLFASRVGTDVCTVECVQH